MGFLKGSVSKSQAKRNYRQAFGDLEDGTVYWDPMGARVGTPTNLKKEFYENDKPAIDLFNQAQEKGFSVQESIDQVKKNLDTGDWTMPIYHLPEVTVLNPYQTPAWDLLARETVKNTTAKVTYESGLPSPTWGLESTGDPGSNEYSYATGTYGTYSYDIVGCGFANAIEDKLALGTRSLRNASNVVENSMMLSMGYEMEKQIIRGDTSSGTGNDANGWSGLPDLGTEYTTVADHASFDNLSKTRELIDEVEKKGGNRNNIAIFTMFSVYEDLANELDDFTRYELGDEDELGFGFKTLNFDGVPVYKSHGFEADGSIGSSDPIMIAVDMSNNYLGMLQDVTLKPLALRGPQEEIAIDCYSTLISENKPRIQYIAHA